jgi:hypothetical protein
MSDFSIHVDGFDKIEKRLAELPAAIGGAGLAAASSYFIGVLVNKEVPNYKYISRTQAPWASEKQRRYVMAAIKRGDIEIPYRRAGRYSTFGVNEDVQVTGIQGEWNIDVSGNPRRVSITNTKSYAHWLYGSDQARRAGLIGWKKMTRLLMEYEKNIVAAFERGVKTAIRKSGMGK